jgi:hypothetical protein
MSAWNCSAEPKRAAAGDDDLGAGELGPLARGDLRADEAGQALVAGRATASTVPLPPSAAAFSNAVPRTVRTSLESLVLTVAMALPA